MIGQLHGHPLLQREFCDLVKLNTLTTILDSYCPIGNSYIFNLQFRNMFQNIEGTTIVISFNLLK